MINSCIYNGDVSHTRFKPIKHHLKYKTFSLLIDLDEIEKLDNQIPIFSLNKFNILSKVFIFLYLFGAFLVLFVWQGREGSFGQRLLIGVIPFCAYQLCIFLNNKKKNFLVP